MGRSKGMSMDNKKQDIKSTGVARFTKKGVLMPLVKKGNREVVKDYRKVMLMFMLCNLYITFLSKRLEEEFEEVIIEPVNQKDLRKGM